MADNIDLLAGKIAELADKATGPGLEAAIEAARMEAWSALAGGAAGMAFAGIAAFIASRLWKHGAEAEADGDFNWWAIGAVTLYIIAGLMVLINSWAFIDPRTWVTLSNPEYWLAKRVLGI